MKYLHENTMDNREHFVFNTVYLNSLSSVILKIRTAFAPDNSGKPGLTNYFSRLKIDTAGIR
jgi:hypothetical protein